MAEQRHTGNPWNFAGDRGKASRAGHTGGQHSAGNFANDPERAAEAGRKGGQGGHVGGAEHNPGNSHRIVTRPRTLAARAASTNRAIAC